MHFARSGIESPLKVFSIFGVISGMLLISSLAYLALVVNLGPVDYNSQLAFLFFTMVGMTSGLLVIIGGLVVLSAPMTSNRGGCLPSLYS